LNSPKIIDYKFQIFTIFTSIDKSGSQFGAIIQNKKGKHPKHASVIFACLLTLFAYLFIHESNMFSYAYVIHLLYNFVGKCIIWSKEDFGIVVQDMRQYFYLLLKTLHI
jgi:hypothetical protein